MSVQDVSTLLSCRQPVLKPSWMVAPRVKKVARPKLRSAYAYGIAQTALEIVLCLTIKVHCTRE